MKGFVVNISIGVTTFLVGTLVCHWWLTTRDLPAVPAPSVRIDDRLTLNPDLHLGSRRVWKSEILKRFDEPEIEAFQSTGDKIYRLVLLPTFDRPIAIRVYRGYGRAFLDLKVLDGRGGYGIDALGELAYGGRRELSYAEWNEFEEALEASDFWYEPAINRSEPMVNDGATWVLEASRDGLNHTVKRAWPNAQLRCVFDHLLKLAKVQEEYDGY